MTRTVVLIPCFNEEQTIGQVVEDFRAAMPHAQVYVYDNNSTDDTARIAAEHGATVRAEPRQGKGNVVRSMFRDIDADCYIMADGDDTYPAAFGPVLEDLVIAGKADMAIGDRLSSSYFAENKRPFHNTGNVMVRNLVNALFRANIKDVMTGARAFSRDFAKLFPCLCEGFEVETEMTVFALEHNMRICEVPIEYRDRPPGSASKLSTCRDGGRVLMTIARLVRDARPLAFFSVISAAIALAMLLLFVPIFQDYLATGQVARFPTLIMLGAGLTVAVVCFFSGVILSAMKRRQLEAFERDYNLLRLVGGGRAGGAEEGGSGRLAS